MGTLKPLQKWPAVEGHLLSRIYSSMSSHNPCSKFSPCLFMSSGMQLLYKWWITVVFNITFTDYCIAFYPDVVDISLWKKKLLCLSNTDNNKISLPYGQGILVIWFCPCISSLPREILFYDRFDFSGTLPLKFDNQSSKTFEALHAGQTDGIFMWWDLEMDTKNKINLSCAPGWGHPRPEELQWRDHWMQAIYYPNQPLSVQKGDKVKVISSHDEYSLWFNVQQTNRYWTFICPLQFRLTCYIVIYSIISNV